MGVNWQKWVTEDLGLSLDDVSSVRISRDIAASDPFIDILTGSVGNNTNIWILARLRLSQKR